MPELTEQLVFGHVLSVGQLPAEIDREGRDRFDEFWDLHPEKFHEFRQPTGNMIPLPRWQQAYGYDYRYSGNVNRALPIPTILERFLSWSKRIDEQLNGLLLNWYDAEKGHYIGPHSDSTIGLVVGTPIVTISLGATRTFRVRSRKEKGFVDFDASHGTVFVMPWETNLKTKHEVPREKNANGRRVSITVRAFNA
jgi:alkylated DNA repair dioxygenase AlkB